MRMYSSEPYRPLYKSPEHNIILNCPRLSGKSYEVSQFGAYSKMLYKDRDGIVFRANANSLLSSVVNDTLEKFVALGWGEKVRISVISIISGIAFAIDKSKGRCYNYGKNQAQISKNFGGRYGEWSKKPAIQWLK